MKKLLIVWLVLGIASLATAGLQFSVNGSQYADGSTVLVTSGPTTVGIYNDTSKNGVYSIQWIEVEPGAEVPGSGTVNEALLPGVWSISDWGLYSGMYYWYINMDVPAVGSTQVGDLFTVDVLLGFLLETTVTMYDSTDLGYIGSITLVAPEPTTMALLALGGVVLSRRKK
ncbi:MAG: PEP-CTERM sorting domain-containing protein [Planctomycetota bacterium]|jgi:hypothetical protein